MTVPVVDELKSLFALKDLRQALGSFPTGVCVVTTRSPDGADVGFTANSFSSVSLNPPMILWSLANASSALPAFQRAAHFAVHVLSQEQDDLSVLFSRKGVDRFSDLKIERGVGGVPLLDRCAARFQCETAHQYNGGDHTIFVGKVLSFDRVERKPLVFHGGKYGCVVNSDLMQAVDTTLQRDSLSEDGINYLLWRAFLQFRRTYHAKRLEYGWSDLDSYVLQTVSMDEGRSVEDVDRRIAFSQMRCTPEFIDRLMSRGLAAPASPVTWSTPVRLTDLSRKQVYHLVAIARSVETVALNGFDRSEAYLLKQLLSRLIQNTLVSDTPPGVPT